MKENYVDVLKQRLKTSAGKFMLGSKCAFQMDNDLNHTFKIVAKWFTYNKDKVLEWPSKSLEFKVSATKS